MRSAPKSWPHKPENGQRRGLTRFRRTSRTNPVLRWLEYRLPLVGLAYSAGVSYPTPRNLNYWWDVRRHPVVHAGRPRWSPASSWRCTTRPHADLAFSSVEQTIMRDVNLRLASCAICTPAAPRCSSSRVYVHMARGMYYGSYKEPREVLWILGVILYLLMMATGFLGYTLPWGPDELLGAPPSSPTSSRRSRLVGEIRGDLGCGAAIRSANPTLQRFFSLHYLLPFRDRGCGGAAHLGAAHGSAQNNPTGVDPQSEKDTVAFHAPTPP